VRLRGERDRSAKCLIEENIPNCVEDESLGLWDSRPTVRTVDRRRSVPSRMANVCSKHPFEFAEATCRRCGNEFCGGCLVYSHGSTRPPYCVSCALVAGGVRRGATEASATRARVGTVLSRMRPRSAERRAMNGRTIGVGRAAKSTQDGTNYTLQMPGPRRRRPRFPWLRRRGWVLVLTILFGAGDALLVTALHDNQYSSQAVLVVQSGASDAGPGSANEAATLGITYADLIPRDNEIVQYVSTKLGITTDEVQQGISVSTQSGTSLLLINFRNRSATISRDGAILVAQSISGPTPVTSTIPANSVALVHLPTEATISGNPWQKVGALGLVLGFAVGAALIVAWERADPRVDDARQLAEDAPFPVWNGDEFHRGMAIALLARWRSFAGEHGLHNIALVVLGNGLPEADLQIRAVLEHASEALKGVPADESSAVLGGEIHVAALSRAQPGRASNGPAMDRVPAELPDIRFPMFSFGRDNLDPTAAINTLGHLGASVSWGFVLSHMSRREVAGWADNASTRPTDLEEISAQMVPAIPSKRERRASSGG
jgi:capsular polysaccharide biosynthesis protein